MNNSVENWDVIVIGHLKWNPYFGESQDAPPRGDPSTCTSTLIRGRQADGTPYALLVDPTLRNSPEEYYFDLNRRTGLHPGDITHCFATHEHFDHQAGLNYFPNAVWLSASDLKDSPYIPGEKVQKAEGEIFPGVEAVHLPGHTGSLHGIAFRFEGKRILIAADSVMSKYHYQNETCMFETDSAQAAETIRFIKREFDIIVPGHDNLIVNARCT